ncbi:hypothetical protein C8F01DRAFT_1084446 [Mycena amicta]|nr:hypothetical protein C8F01DRAFT_1084446 [Mycena amicta]
MVEMFEEDPEDEKVKAMIELWTKVFGTDRLQDISNCASSSNPNLRSAKLKATQLAHQWGLFRSIRHVTVTAGDLAEIFRQVTGHQRLRRIPQSSTKMSLFLLALVFFGPRRG